MDIDTIQIILQGGFAGVLLAFGFGVYRLWNRVIEIANTLVSNHIAHLTTAIDHNTRVLTALERAIKAMNRRERKE